MGWTGCEVESHMFFTRERHARWARHVAEEIMKIMYAEDMPEKCPWIEEAQEVPSLSQRYLKYRHEAAEMKMDYESALDHIARCRTRLDMDRLADVARWTRFDNPEQFFPQLCFAYALRFPQAPFTATFRYEMTVTGSIQVIRVCYDGRTMHVREKSGIRPFDEYDLRGVGVRDYRAENGVFKAVERG